MSEENHRSENFWTALILGIILGAGIFYFLSSTEAGKKVKKKIAEKSDDVLENLADIVEEVEKKSKEFRKEAQKVKGEIEKKAINPTLSQIRDLQERGRRAIRFFTRNGKPLS